MDTGAVAVIDALGFKGIWQRHSPSEVFDALRAVEAEVSTVATSCSEALALLTGKGRLVHRTQGSVRFVSDTIVLALHTRGLEPETDARRIALLEGTIAVFTVSLVAFAIMAGSQGGVPMNYRGAIAWGKFLLEGNFMLGDAIDRAALLHERADAACVELTPEMAFRVRGLAGLKSVPEKLTPDRLIFEAKVPLKRGGTETSWVVNPFAMCSSAREVHDVLDGMKRAFGKDGSTAHAAKYKNTMDLLAEGRRSLTRG